MLASAVALFGVLTAANLRLFGSLLAPIYLTFAIEFFLRTLIGYVAYYYLFPSDLGDPAFLDSALLLSMLYAATFFAGVAVANAPLERLVTRISSLSVTSSNERAGAMALPSAMTALAVGLLALAGLAVFGGGGTLWVTDTRAAYLTYRSGFGFLWSLFASSIPLSMLLLVHLGKVRLGWRYLLVVPAYLMLAYFTGSKQTLLAVVFALLVYRHYYVRPLSTARLGVVFGLLGFSFVATTILQGSFETLFEAMSYFDYIHVTAKYLEASNSLSAIRGLGVASYLWSFVPRGLLTGKPFEYGTVLINSYLFPGAAEQGYTPAFLEWALAHLDAGFLGVAALGFLKGQVVSSFFRVWQRNLDNLFLFLFNCQLGFMVFNMPGVYELALLLALGTAWSLKKLSAYRVVI